MYFPQEHSPGREAQFDFTHCGELKVTIAGQPYPHLLFQLILSHSGWRYAEVAAGETFLALQQGLQAALWTLGRVPEILRSDNTSAATHEVKRSRGRALNDNYAALLDHYGLRSTRINRGQSHENDVAEHAHYRLKDAIDQALILRGSRAFDTVDDYADFVRQMVERRNRLVQGKLEQEMLCLRSLPPAPVPEYVNYQSQVRKWSTIQVAGRTYTVPSRLIGKEVQIRLYADWVEVYYKGHLVERMERVRGEGGSQRQLPPRHRLPGTQARSLRPLPLPRATVSHPALQAGLRRAPGVAWGTGRRGVRADLALGGDHHGSHGGQRPVVAAGSRRVLRLRGGAGPGPAQGAQSPGADSVWEAGPENLRPPAQGQPGRGGGVRMTDASVIQDRIGQLCSQFKLPTVGAQSVTRFTAAGHGDALPTFVEVLEQEAEDRRHRRTNRLRRESRLPSGKTWETFEHNRVPLALRQQLDHLAQGSFVERGVNVLAFGLPGTGQDPRPVRPGPPAGGSRPLRSLRSGLPPGARTAGCQARPGSASATAQAGTTSTSCSWTTWATCPRAPKSPRYLFTLIAERYERRSLGITSNLVFSEWERIFANPMATAAAIDRVVHHSVILEFDVPSYRTNAAQQRGQAEEVNRQT